MNKSAKKENTFGRLIGYIFKHYAPQLIITIICIIISALASVIATIFLQRIIDEVVTPALGIGMDPFWNKFIKIIFTMGGIYLLGVIASFTYTRLMATVTQGTLMHLRNDMFERMQTLPIKYFDTNAHGDIMSTYTNDTDAIRQLIGQSLPLLFQSSLIVLGIVIMMLGYSIWLTIVVAIFIFLMTRVVKNFGGKSAKYMLNQQRTLAKEEGFVEEMMEGAKVIKVFNHEAESKKSFDEINEELFKASDEANKYGNMLMPALGNIGNILYVALAVVGGLLVYYNVYNLSFQNITTGSHSIVSLGIMVSFLSMARQLSQTIGQISAQVSMITMGIAGAKRVFELMDQEPEFDEGYVTLVRAKYNKEGQLVEADEDTSLWAWKHPHKADSTVTYTPLKGDIVLEDVDFGYVKDKLVLHDISLYAKPGQKIAFVGATGAGKTTITNLINRFYDIADGKIRYDGINITKIRKSDLRRSLGIVLQDVNLFTGTVLDNIRYGKLEATDEECIAAAKLANAHHFIERLPEGYNTMLTSNGANLSQGQRQLLSIARAAVANPPVMILDEATSSIDTRTEAIVQAGMDNLMFGRTVFVIAHRLSTVRNSQAIMVLDHGRIIERGDHDSLIDQKGTYYQLYTGAFELE